MADEILKAKLQQISDNDTQIGTSDLEIKGQVNALRQYGMGVTGIQRDRLGDVVYDLADGYGQGGASFTKTFLAEVPVTWTNTNTSLNIPFTTVGDDYDCIIFELWKSGSCVAKAFRYTTFADSFTYQYLMRTADDGYVPMSNSNFPLNHTHTAGTNENLISSWLRMTGNSASYFPDTIKIYQTKIRDALYNI